MMIKFDVFEEIKNLLFFALSPKFGKRMTSNINGKCSEPDSHLADFILLIMEE